MKLQRNLFLAQVSRREAKDASDKRLDVRISIEQHLDVLIKCNPGEP